MSFLENNYETFSLKLSFRAEELERLILEPLFKNVDFFVEPEALLNFSFNKMFLDLLEESLKEKQLKFNLVNFENYIYYNKLDFLINNEITNDFIIHQIKRCFKLHFNEINKKIKELNLNKKCLQFTIVGGILICVKLNNQNV